MSNTLLTQPRIDDDSLTDEPGGVKPVMIDTNFWGKCFGVPSTTFERVEDFYAGFAHAFMTMAEAAADGSHLRPEDALYYLARSALKQANRLQSRRKRDEKRDA